MDRRFFNTKEIALYLGESEHTIRAWVKKAYIPYSKLGRSVRFDLQRIELWLKDREKGLPLKEF